MNRHGTNTGRGAAALLMVVAAGCGSGAPVAPDKVRLSEQQLLVPFARDVVVGCGELEIACTANFHANISQPAFNKQVHSMVKNQLADGTETVWTNTSGNPDSGFVVTIGPIADLAEPSHSPQPRTKFRVVNQVRLKVYEGTHALALDARAHGGFAYVLDASGKQREGREFSIKDGVLREP